MSVVEPYPMVHTVVGQQYPHTLSVVDQNSRIDQYFDINVKYWYIVIFLFCKKKCFLKIPQTCKLKCE